MVQAVVGQDLEAGAHGAGFGVIGSVDEVWDAGLNHGAGAHAAGLDSDVERGAGETVIAKQACGFTKDHHFRVGGGVAVADGTVARTGEDSAVTHEDGANWHFTGRPCRAGFSQRFLHELNVSFHRKTENSMWKGGVSERTGKQAKRERKG